MQKHANFSKRNRSLLVRSSFLSRQSRQWHNIFETTMLFFHNNAHIIMATAEKKIHRICHCKLGPLSQFLKTSVIITSKSIVAHAKTWWKKAKLPILWRKKFFHENFDQKNTFLHVLSCWSADTYTHRHDVYWKMRPFAFCSSNNILQKRHDPNATMKLSRNVPLLQAIFLFSVLSCVPPLCSCFCLFGHFKSIRNFYVTFLPVDKTKICIWKWATDRHDTNK